MCVHRTDEGFCKKFSVDGVTSYCVEGPCPDDVLTNADRIRRMSDEELAKQLYDMQKQLCIHFAKAVGFPVEELQFQEDAPDILDWLQQPAEEDA